MAQHRIVRQISEVFATTLEDGVKDILGRTIQVVTGPPLREKFTRLPALGVYLYRVVVLPQRREFSPTLVTTIDQEGNIEEYFQDPSVYLGLDYLISAWADDDPELQELLGAATRAMLMHPVFEGSTLEGDAFDPEDRVVMRPVEDLSAEFLMSLWRGFGEHLRPSVAYRAKAWLDSPRRVAGFKRVGSRQLVVDR
ncbi:MAG: DUF4255 domain-containing protein [Bradymonadia bacterium]